MSDNKDKLMQEALDAQTAVFGSLTAIWKALEEKDAREAREKWAREGKPPLT